MQTAKQNFGVQKIITIISVVLLEVKVLAYWFTHSVSVLTDASESIVNVIAGFIGLYSLYLVQKPRDNDHPYGHGKAEFISAAVEGTLMLVAAIFILVQAIENLVTRQPIHSIDTGLYLTASTAIVNYFAGWYCIKLGKKNNSLALQASGKHLQTDTYSTIGIVLALGLMWFTNWYWVDGAVAAMVSTIIFYSGYTILRASLAGIMDEADENLLNQLVAYLNKHRHINWIDLHNLRVIKYGSTLHVDCHLTIPWYFTIKEGHKEVDELGLLIKKEFGDSLELFVHTDACLPFSCTICTLPNCSKREVACEQQIVWTLDNIISNQRHGRKGNLAIANI